MLAVVLIGSGVWQFFPSAARPSLVGPALVVSGIAILFRRSWGYYLAYVVAFVTLLPPQRTWLIPGLQPLRRMLWLYAGMEPELISVLVSLLCAGVLGWTHYALHQSHQLDQPLSARARRATTVIALVASIAAVLVPVLIFISQLILDPPSRGGAGAPAGGLRAFLVLFVGWPFMFGGVIGTIVCRLILKRQSRAND